MTHISFYVVFIVFTLSELALSFYSGLSRTSTGSVAPGFGMRQSRLSSSTVTKSITTRQRCLWSLTFISLASRYPMIDESQRQRRGRYIRCFLEGHRRPRTLHDGAGNISCAVETLSYALRRLCSRRFLTCHGATWHLSIDSLSHQTRTSRRYPAGLATRVDRDAHTCTDFPLSPPARHGDMGALKVLVCTSRSMALRKCSNP